MLSSKKVLRKDGKPTEIPRLVGLYSDETVRFHRNRGKPPVLTLLERALAAHLAANQ